MLGLRSVGRCERDELWCGVHVVLVWRGEVTRWLCLGSQWMMNGKGVFEIWRRGDVGSAGHRYRIQRLGLMHFERGKWSVSIARDKNRDMYIS